MNKLLKVKDLLKHIPKEAFICVMWKGDKIIPDGGTLKELKHKKYIHDMEIVTFVQDEIEGVVYVDIEVM